MEIFMKSLWTQINFGLNTHKALPLSTSSTKWLNICQGRKEKKGVWLIDKCLPGRKQKKSTIHQVINDYFYKIIGSTGLEGTWKCEQYSKLNSLVCDRIQQKALIDVIYLSFFIILTRKLFRCMFEESC